MNEEYIMDEIYQPPQRPTIISVICVIGFIWILVATLLFLVVLGNIPFGYESSPDIKILSIIMLAVMLLLIIPLIGIWQMKKWGAISYLILSGIGLVSTFTTTKAITGPKLLEILIEIGTCIILILYLPKMSSANSVKNSDSELII